MNVSTSLRHPTLILRVTLAAILIMHSIPGLLNGGVAGFGEYLDQSGFKPFGLILAWSLKLAHVVGAILFLLNRFTIPNALVQIGIFLMGIIMVHGPHGWYVVGNGTNGIEFNVLLIAVCVYLIIREIHEKKRGGKIEHSQA